MNIVIRAGGSGTRLWPLSRRSTPKQFQRILDSQTMISATVDRIVPLSSNYSQLWVSVNTALLPKAVAELPKLAADHFIVEPEARNTGPAICLEACFLEKRVSPETIIASLPSDDYISDQEAFRSMLLASEAFIQANPEYIVAPAVKPSYPEVGYSYLKAGQQRSSVDDVRMFEVADLVEKPTKEKCEELIKTGIYYWHTGMYLWQLGNVLNLFEKYQPIMLSTCRQIVSLMGDESKQLEIANLYSRLEKISIESAITHQTEKVAMSVSDKLGWSDVGKWPAVKRLRHNDAQGNSALSKTLLHKSSDTLSYSYKAGKLVILNSVKNLAIIDTEDVLLISDLDMSEDIKEIIDKLINDDQEKYL